MTNCALKKNSFLYKLGGKLPSVQKKIRQAVEFNTCTSSFSFCSDVLFFSIAVYFQIGIAGYSDSVYKIQYTSATA